MNWSLLLLEIKPQSTEFRPSQISFPPYYSSILIMTSFSNYIYLLTYMRVFGFGQKTPPSQDGCIDHYNVDFP